MKMDVIGYVLGGGVVVGVMGTLLVLVEESIPGVWAIPLAIITLILGGLLFLRARKLREQRTKKFKDLAEQMGMEFSAKGDSALLESLSAFDLFSKGDAAATRNSLTNVLHYSGHSGRRD